MAYQFPVVGAFWPLVCGLYWKRSTTQGRCGRSRSHEHLGGSRRHAAGEVFPSVLGGFIMAAIGMVAGSLVPTAGNRAHHEHRARHGHAVPPRVHPR